MNSKFSALLTSTEFIVAVMASGVIILILVYLFFEKIKSQEAQNQESQDQDS